MMKSKATPTWVSAKHLLDEYDGAATEIFVVGLPLCQLSAVIATIADLPALEVLSYADEYVEPSEPFDGRWRRRFETIPRESCQHALRSASGTADHLQIYLWMNATDESLEVEFVFWNDLHFPPRLADSERERRLGRLVSLAESWRKGVDGAQAILAREHNGPAHELFQMDGRYAIVW